MNFFKRKRTIRRYSEPKEYEGYITIPYGDLELPMDVQTLECVSVTTEDGTKSVQRLKAFCDFPILTENRDTQQKADRLWFQDKWFDCTSCRLSENTPLRHYTATFVELLDQEPAPSKDTEESEVDELEHGGSQE